MNKNNYTLSEANMRAYWYFYETGKIKDLTQYDIRQINNYINTNPKDCRHMWKIGKELTILEKIKRYFYKIFIKIFSTLYIPRGQRKNLKKETVIGIVNKL